jgi:hypothetical protein
MVKITEELNLDYVHEVLKYGRRIKDMIGDLERKGAELAKEVTSLEELEGKAEVQGENVILLACPMVPVLNELKKEHKELLGIEKLPAYFPDIVDMYISMNPNSAAILHPLCIAHQHIRKEFGKAHGAEIEQIACRSGATGEVVYAKAGLDKAKMTEDDAKKLLGERACLYWMSGGGGRRF